MAEAELRILKSVEGTIDDYLEVQLHLGTAAVSAHIAMLEQTEMVAGQSQMVQLRLKEPLPVVPGERFIVRANSVVAGQTRLTTLGGGVVLGVSDTRLRRKRPWTLEVLARRRAALGRTAEWCEAMLLESTEAMDGKGLAAKCLLQVEEMNQVLTNLLNEGRVVRTRSGGWAHSNAVQKIAVQAQETIRGFHQTHSSSVGISRDDLAKALEVSRELADLAIDRLLAQKSVQEREGLVALQGWTVRVPDRDQARLDALAEQLRKAHWTPPSRDELPGLLGIPAPQIPPLCKLLVERGVLVVLDDRTWMHRDAVEAGKQIALKLFLRSSSFSTMDFRDALAVSRKYAVPLLDYLDRVRFTVRNGNLRTPGVEARKLFPPTAASPTT